MSNKNIKYTLINTTNPKQVISIYTCIIHKIIQDLCKNSKISRLKTGTSNILVDVINVHNSPCGEFRVAVVTSKDINKSLDKDCIKLVKQKINNDINTIILVDKCNYVIYNS